MAKLVYMYMGTRFCYNFEMFVRYCIIPVPYKFLSADYEALSSQECWGFGCIWMPQKLDFVFVGFNHRLDATHLLPRYVVHMLYFTLLLFCSLQT